MSALIILALGLGFAALVITVYVLINAVVGCFSYWETDEEDE